MPKKQISINKFSNGILNRYDKRDVPEGGLYTLVDVIPDIEGSLRMIGSEIDHTNLALSTASIAGLITPGMGLFAFNADFAMTYESNAGLFEEGLGSINSTRQLAIQNNNTIGIWDSLSSTFIPDVITINSDNTITIAPHISYIDGVLRVSDTDFINVSGDLNADGSNYVKQISYIRKKRFRGSANAPSDSTVCHPSTYDGSLDPDNESYVTLGSWIESQSYIFPPSVASDGAVTHNLYSTAAQSLKRTANTTFPNSDSSHADFTDVLTDGNITLLVTEGDAGTVDTGEFMAGTYNFGISFQYDGNQESQVTSFAHAFTGTRDNVPYAFQLFATLDTDEAFDVRVNGINVYITGQDGSFLDDPLWVGYWHWGSNDNDTTYFETHEGNKTSEIHYEVADKTFYVKGESATIPGMSGTDITYAGVAVFTYPGLTFEIRNGYNNTSKSIAARYKTSVTANRKTYIGGIQRYKFDTSTIHSGDTNSVKQCTILREPFQLDRMIKSPVNQFDIFPEESFIDVAINDGESIVHLAAFNDRILQFKETNLYVINISGDYEYLEAQYKFLGVKKPHQVIEIPEGIVFVNDIGCYLYNGEGPPVNLIDKRLKLDHGYELNSLGPKFNSWDQFASSGILLGYIKKLKQIVLFKGPGISSSGDVMIFDIPTQSWAFGKDRNEISQKSNVVINYDNSCMFLSNKAAGGGTFETNLLSAYQAGTSIVFELSGVNSTYTFNAGTYLQIGSRAISSNIVYTTQTDWPFEVTNDLGVDNFGEYITLNVNNVGDPTVSATYLAAMDIVVIVSNNPADDGNNMTFTANPNIQNYAPAAITINDYGYYKYCTHLFNGDLNHYPQSSSDTLPQSDWGGSGITGVSSMRLRWGAGNTNMSILQQAEGNQPYRYIILPIILQHAALSGCMVQEGKYANYYNPFGFSEMAHLSSNASNTQPPYFSNQEKHHEYYNHMELLNVDTVNYSKMTLTRTDGSNYIWGSAFQVFVFGVAPAADVAMSYNSFTFFGYTGTGHGGVDLGADAKFRDDGQPNGTGNVIQGHSDFVFSDHAYVATGTVATLVETIHNDTDSTLKIPAVVFRLLRPYGSASDDYSQSELHISLLGDNTDSQFSVGSKYTISASGSNSTSNCNSNESNHLTNLKLSDIETYSHFEGFSTGGPGYMGDFPSTGGGEENDGNNEGDPGYANSLTVLIFKYQDQEDSAGANDPLYNSGAKWAAIKSYGDVCDDAISFTNGAGTNINAQIDNSNNDLIPGEGAQYIAHPIRVVTSGGAFQSNTTTYTLDVENYLGNNKTVSSIPTEVSNAISLSLDLINSFQTGDSFDSTIGSIGLNKTTGTFARTGATTFTFTKDLLAEGFEAGDTIFLNKSDNIGTVHSDFGSNFYIIQSITQFNGTVCAVTIDTFNHASLHTDVIPSGLGSGNVADTYIHSSGIKVLGNAGVQQGQLNVSSSSTQGIEVKEFINDVGFVETSNNKESSHLQIETKDIDFGSPGSKKKIYYIDITYSYASVGSGDLASVEVYIKKNNGYTISDPLSGSDIASGLFPTHNADDSSSWNTTRLYFNSNRNTITAKSISILIASTNAVKRLKINDITISYRELGR